MGLGLFPLFLGLELEGLPIKIHIHLKNILKAEQSLRWSPLTSPCSTMFVESLVEEVEGIVWP